MHFDRCENAEHVVNMDTPRRVDFSVMCPIGMNGFMMSYEVCR